MNHISKNLSFSIDLPDLRIKSIKINKIESLFLVLYPYILLYQIAVLIAYSHVYLFSIKGVLFHRLEELAPDHSFIVSEPSTILLTAHLAFPISGIGAFVKREGYCAVSHVEILVRSGNFSTAYIVDSVF